MKKILLVVSKALELEEDVNSSSSNFKFKMIRNNLISYMKGMIYHGSAFKLLIITLRNLLSEGVPVINIPSLHTASNE